MTASVQIVVPVSAPALEVPLSLPVAEYHPALRAGVVPVDIRSQRKRQSDGALLGAIALDAAEVIELLTPGSPTALRAAAHDARWVLVSDDGHEAEWVAWHLQARGIAGAVFLVGGYRALQRAGINGQINQGEFDVFSAH